MFEGQQIRDFIDVYFLIRMLDELEEQQSYSLANGDSGVYNYHGKKIALTAELNELGIQPERMR